MLHLYRKAYKTAFEAEETANGFHLFPNIDKLGTPKVFTAEEDGTHYVYVELEGEYDPQEVLEATGYERIR